MPPQQEWALGTLLQNGKALQWAEMQLSGSWNSDRQACLKPSKSQSSHILRSPGSLPPWQCWRLTQMKVETVDLPSSAGDTGTPSYFLPSCLSYEMSLTRSSLCLSIGRGGWLQTTSLLGSTLESFGISPLVLCFGVQGAFRFRGENCSPSQSHPVNPALVCCPLSLALMKQGK